MTNIDQLLYEYHRWCDVQQTGQELPSFQEWCRLFNKHYEQ